MAFGNRGVYAEGKVLQFLQEWCAADPHREASRLVDTKSAGRVIKAAKADFEYFVLVPTFEGVVGVHGLIEVKQTEHDYRLERTKVTQLASLRKREKTGGRCYVVVFHSVIKCWRAMSVPWLMANGDKGSWNLMALPTFKTAGEALEAVSSSAIVVPAK